MQIRGTTFSGLSTRTTLGNTLRSIAYMYYYLEEAGIRAPWNNPGIAVIASGDDTVCWVEPEYENRVVASILRLSARDSSPQVVGLGQVIKEVDTGDFW